MSMAPPPPPPPPGPIIVNCGELRDRHHGCLVEIYGRVSKQRMGRFIELKDQNGVTQLVAPDSVSFFSDDSCLSHKIDNINRNSFLYRIQQLVNVFLTCQLAL